MRIPGTGIPAAAAPAPQGADSAPVGAASTSAAAASAAPASGPLQSAALAPALAALREMPEIDQAKVAALRDALAKGEVPFDPAKLAGLIERFHGGRS
jgi:negative regulator of flagellin synthesis FlgM